MASTHTVILKPLVPVGGSSRGGWKSYIGKYTTMRVVAGGILKLSPALNVISAEVKDAVTNDHIPISSTASASASTGFLVTATTEAPNGVSVLVIGKTQ